MSVKGRARYEVIVVVIVIVVAVVLAVGLYSRRGKVQNDKILMNELSAMRTSVSLYVTLNKEMPASLKDLTMKTYNLGDGVQKPYLDGIASKIDAAGKFMDPYGNPYGYDPRKGFVYSTTKGYEKW